MPRRKTPLLRGQYYHFYNRGHNREPIFLEAENYLFFLRQLRLYVTTEQATVIAYVLMPNHYHLLVQARADSLSKAMQRLGISYSMAMNARYRHTDSMFEGAFEARLVDQDIYLTHLSRYIHLNPVRANLVRSAEDWPYSSYQDYLGLRRGTLPQSSIVLDQFSSPHAYQEFVQSYVAPDRECIAQWLF